MGFSRNTFNICNKISMHLKGSSVISLGNPFISNEILSNSLKVIVHKKACDVNNNCRINTESELYNNNCTITTGDFNMSIR